MRKRLEELSENRLLFFTTYINSGLIVASVMATWHSYNTLGAFSALTAIFLAAAVGKELNE